MPGEFAGAGAMAENQEAQEAVMAQPGTCCCGRPYSERGGESSDYCLAGARNLCAECVSNWKGHCLTHGIPVKW